jgi:histidinol-phosphatase (PHP family)
MINSHVHSKYSVDSNAQLQEIFDTAIERGLTGVAITDHVPFWYYKNGFDNTALLECKNEIQSLKEKYQGRLKILFGMEVSEHHVYPDYEKQALAVGGFDVVLCSLHDVVDISAKKIHPHFIENDFTKLSKEELIELVKNYYSMLKNQAKNSDYDVLSHLTYPFRYICCREKIDLDYQIVIDDIKEILQIVIDRKKAIELNTSNCDNDFFMPNEEILKMYKQMGGELITIGSDAHVAKNIDKGLLEGKELLKKCGFAKYYYYENRKPKIAETL